MGDFSTLASELAQRKAQHLYRRRRLLTSPQGPTIVADGQPLLAFCSNDYLGLANHPDVIAAFQQAAERYGVGSGSAHLVIGHSAEHHALEEELAAFTGRPRALLFSTGYMANLGAIQALLGSGDSVFEDKLNHASLLDGGLACGARFQRYLHNDMNNLAKRLARDTGVRKLIVSDGVFSMDGDVAPVAELTALAAQHGAWLMIDDAHGFGCLGARGEGLVAGRYDQDQVQLLVGTLGKAFGTGGAFVAASDTVIETLIQQARTYIYTTAMPPAVAAATRASLRLLQTEAWRRERLQQLITQFRRGAAELGLRLMDSPTPIQPIVVGDAERALRWSQQLEARGILVTAIRPPTVPRGSARLRVTLSAAHDEQQVQRLLDALAEIAQGDPGPEEVNDA